MDYKALYEKQLKENVKIKEEHKDEIIRLESDYQADYDELEQGSELLAKLYKEHKIEIMQLKEVNKKLNWEDDTLEDTLSSLNFYTEVNEELKEENKMLKAQQFDDMEALAKSDGMCLVDIKIFDKLIEEEKENKELTEENEELQEENKKLKEVITKNYQKQINMTLMGVEPVTEKE